MKTVFSKGEQRMRARRAFTLIEIMIAISVMAVVMTAGVPAFVRAFHKEGMRKAVADVTEACNAARAEAVLNSKQSALEFQPREKTFRAGKFSSALPPDVNIISIGVNFVELSQADSAKVVFYPNGISDEFEITLQGRDGEMCQIYLDIVTGSPQLKTLR